MAATTFVKQRTLDYEKTLFPAIKHNNLQGKKCFFKNN